MAVAGTCLSSSASTSSASRALGVTSTLAASTSCSAWLIRSAATAPPRRCRRRAPRSRWVRLGVDAHDALEQPLGRDAWIEPGPVTRSTVARPGAVGEHRDGLGASDRVDLLDPEQRARREDRGVRQPAVVLCGEEVSAIEAHARDLGGHDVHHHAAHQRREAARDVQAHPADRYQPLPHRPARHHLGCYGVVCRARPHSCCAAGLSTPRGPARRSGSSAVERSRDRRSRGTTQLGTAPRRRSGPTPPGSPRRHGSPYVVAKRPDETARSRPRCRRRRVGAARRAAVRRTGAAEATKVEAAEHFGPV